MTTLSRLWLFVLTLCAGMLALALVLLVPEASPKDELRQRAQLGQSAATLLLENQAYQLVAAATRIGSDAVLQSGLDEMGRGQSELEILHQTAQGRLRELTRGVGAAFVLVADAKGRVLARVGQDEAVYRDALDGWPVLAEALRGYRLDDLWLTQGTLYRVAGSPIISAARDRYVGAVVIGQVIGNDLAQSLRGLTGLDATFVAAGRNVGSSRPLPDALLAELLALRPTQPGATAVKERPGHDDALAFVNLPGSAASQGAGLMLFAEGQASAPLLARLQAAAGRGVDRRWLIGLVLAVAAAFAVGLLLLRGEVDAPVARLEALLRGVARRDRGPYLEAAPQIDEVPATGLRTLVLAVNDALIVVHRDAVQARPVPDLPPLPEFPAERISQPLGSGSSGSGLRALSSSGVVTPVVPTAPSLPPGSRPPESGEPTRTTTFGEDTRAAGGGETSVQADPELVDYRIYQEFVLARERCNESVEGLNFEQFRKRLEQSRAEIITQHRCHAVDFQVHVRDGRAMLRATPIWV